ncbi:unnamed protein product [Rotaria sp. Silwood1]|nr:unnamed protein product [Rotaria sp. Silwood1]CAF1650068.1 unnamed protein product [Rotaria sp. Silwood1]CAF3580763.1 unnamed protein product [Rotaria sp. Silwood1]CAF3621018.1 unnamed protein product [Rotaria sp. Silwood1]CAF3635815.1 unnamed protein product [Rotaria sp. Silwood1]
MDDTFTDNLFSLKNEEFYTFIQQLVGQQIVDVLKFQSITSTQSLIRNPDIFEIFNMKCSEPSFLLIREKSCLQLDDGQFIVKIGLINNINYLLDFLKQRQQKKIIEGSYADANPSLSFDFINKHPLLKNLVLYYQRIDNDNNNNEDKYCFLKEFIDTITSNLTKSGTGFRYSDQIKNFALSLYILGGKLTYEFIRLNLPGSLPNLTMLNKLISKSDSKINEGELRFDQLQKHFDQLNIQYAFGSEDATGIIKKIKYDSTTNTFNGFSTPLDCGVPIKEYYQTDSFDTLRIWFNSIEKASLLNVHMVQPIPASNQSIIPSPFLLSAYGIDNTATANDILQRWWYIFNQCLQRNIRIIGFSTDADAKYVRAMRLMSGFFGSLPNFQVHRHPQAFEIKTTSHWPWFYLREQQVLLFFQDATHLVTKWRNRLLSPTAELHLGNQFISINHLHDIINSDIYTKLDHGLTKSDINPKDRQNFSSCLKLTSTDLFKILNDNVNTRGTLIYLQMLKMIVVAYVEKKTTIAELLLVKQKQLPPHVLCIHAFSSQACESIFRNTRALSGIYSTIVNFTVYDFLRRAQRLSLLNDIKCKQSNDESVNNLAFPVHHKHQNDRQSSCTESQNEIDQIDIEQIITKAYHEAIDMLDGLEILNVLKNKRVLDLKLLSEYVFKQLNSNSKMYDYSSQRSNMDDGEFEIDDDDDDDNETTDDLNMDDDNNDSFSSNADYTAEDEQEDTDNSINTTKNEFAGIKICSKVESDTEHCYFKVTINDDTKYLHKQTACWLLTEEKSKLSNDRLLRVQQANKNK